MKEPSDESVLSARLARAYPALSPYSAACLARELCSIERAQRKHAERQCNGDYTRVKRQRGAWGGVAEMTVDDTAAEARAEKQIDRRVVRWAADAAGYLNPRGIGAPDGNPHKEAMVRDAATLAQGITLHGDPRGPV